MTKSRKNRRSERVAALHRMMLTILGPSGAEVLKEIVTTVDISQHGARIRGHRTLQPGWQGALVNLSSGRQAPLRVIRQMKQGDSFETGIELLADFNFWGRDFSNPDAVAEEPAIEDALLPPQEFLALLRKSRGSGSVDDQKLMETIWCGLVEQLEERKVFTRQELVAAIRKLIPA